MNICVFGASSDNLDPFYYQEAEAFGAILASASHHLVFGGGANGVMAACARGAKSSGGVIIGIVPRLFDEPGFLFNGCSEILYTETMSARKEKMFALSDAFVALPGGIGTLDEFFECITLKQLGVLSGPVVLLNTKGFYTPLLQFLRKLADDRFMSSACLELLQVCDNPAQAAEACLRKEALRGSIRRLEDYTG